MYCNKCIYYYLVSCFICLIICTVFSIFLSFKQQTTPSPEKHDLVVRSAGEISESELQKQRALLLAKLKEPESE